MQTLLPQSPHRLPVYPALIRRLRLGIVGGGRISAMQAMAARLSDRWEVVAGALSSDAVNAKARGAQWRLEKQRCYTSFEQMAAAESQREDGVDAVMITTPNHVHAEAALCFLQAGIAVLCDKPMTNTMDEATNLIHAVQGARSVFGVSYVMSCFPMVRQARELVLAGDIGRVNQIHVEFLQDWMTPPESADAEHVQWRLDPARSGATSCTGDIGTHAAHLASFVSGCELTDIRAEMHVCGSPKPLEDTVMMLTRYNQFIPGSLIATRMAPGNRGGLRVRVFGSEGGIEWDLERAEQLKYSRYGEADRVISRGHGHGVSSRVEKLIRSARGFPEGIIEAWGNLYTEFAMAVAASQDQLTLPQDWVLLPDVYDGAKGVRFVEAAVESNRHDGRWTDCRLVTPT
ncbi:MAG: Gfo/Idh/MocA family oxidoreductase [Pseudomonadota bacterium]